MKLYILYRYIYKDREVREIENREIDIFKFEKNSWVIQFWLLLPPNLSSDLFIACAIVTVVIVWKTAK